MNGSGCLAFDYPFRHPIHNSMAAAAELGLSSGPVLCLTLGPLSAIDDDDEISADDDANDDDDDGMPR